MGTRGAGRQTDNGGPTFRLCDYMFKVGVGPEDPPGLLATHRELRAADLAHIPVDG